MKQLIDQSPLFL